MPIAQFTGGRSQLLEVQNADPLPTIEIQTKKPPDLTCLPVRPLTQQKPFTSLHHQ